MTEVNKGDFEGLVQGEGSWSGCWLVPEEVFVQGCGERGELIAVQPGCTMVLQRSFPVWLEYITGVLSSFFPLVGPSHAKPSWPAHITLQDSTTYTSDTTQRILRNY